MSKTCLLIASSTLFNSAIASNTSGSEVRAVNHTLDHRDFSIIRPSSRVGKW